MVIDRLTLFLISDRALLLELSLINDFYRIATDATFQRYIKMFQNMFRNFFEVNSRQESRRDMEG